LPELLAPAGNLEKLKVAVHYGADAVYLGGKILNMRLHRASYNLTNEELKEAVQTAHGLHKKLYITVNNLNTEQELEPLREYLLFLKELQPDGIIFQDMSVVTLSRELNCGIPLHASVMMNVHNSKAFELLKSFGVSRVVVPREMTLSECKYIAATTGMELEYFIHGDMCISNGGQCLYSGILFGHSANRGRCLKPCRWAFSENGEKTFPLAAKDMYMYENIPELIANNITSFKIEGRMRDADYITDIVSRYDDAISRYLDDPLGYGRALGGDYMRDIRKRDFTTAFAFGNPGKDFINTRFEGTGALYSTGKPFSVAAEERGITEKRTEEIKNILKTHTRENANRHCGLDPQSPCAAVQARDGAAANAQREPVKLNVKVRNKAQADICLRHNVRNIYLSCDMFEKPFTLADVVELYKNKGNKNIYLSAPLKTDDMAFDEFTAAVKKLPRDETGHSAVGVLSSNAGLSWYLKNVMDEEWKGDYSLNITNTESMNFYLQNGVYSFTISPELNLTEALPLFNDYAELIVYGSPTIMLMEHEMPDELTDEKGFTHKIFKDNKNRAHMALYKNINYLPILKELRNAGLNAFRIEAEFLTDEQLTEALESFTKAVKNLDDCEEIFNGMGAKDSYTYGAFEFD